MYSRNILCSLLVVLLICILAVCADEYDRAHYPNPMNDPEECGRNKRSYLCDPDSILNPGEADQLDREIERVTNETKCPCSENSCDSRKYRKGYKIAVALINKMPDDKYVQLKEGGDILENNMEKARLYAYTLLNRWKIGSCNEGIIIFYSKEDNVLYTMTGDTAAKKLKSTSIGEISMEGRGKFGSNNFEGLVYLITQYRDVLMDKYRENDVIKPKTAALTDSSAFSLASTSCVVLWGLLAAVLLL